MSYPTRIRKPVGVVAAGLLITQIALAGCSDGEDDTTDTTTQSTVTTSVESTESTTAPESSESSAAPDPEEAPEDSQIQDPVPEAEQPEGQVPEAPAPEPPAEQAPAEATGPQLGDSCIGADIGRTAVDANGQAIMCDNYSWQLDQGQEPSHPWVDGQREWAECIEVKTQEECRQELNGQ
ncbi:MAG TPA: hypothetical protein H9870_12870 [Candidatus Corynebacterium avicola]|uniref:Secreted protein n=1 Tax=Candidatus Corynebacterium avicola TaxID=2838527 RepID=A0A9D1RRM7_9CORY|nr:hypothetical protein [Candidatus Corynebacterium avicola]